MEFPRHKLSFAKMSFAGAKLDAAKIAATFATFSATAYFL